MLVKLPNMQKENSHHLLFEWRYRIASPSGPDSPTTRLVLLALSLHMDRDGKSCFPSTKTLSSNTGLSERSVCTHLEKATMVGWLKKRIVGVGGQGWRRHGYEASIPAKALKEVQHVQEKVLKEVQQLTSKGTEPHAEGTEPDDKKVLKEVQCNTTVNSRNNTKSLKTFLSDSDEVRLSKLLFSLMQENLASNQKPDLQKWAYEINKLHRIDGRRFDDIENVICWSQKHQFWKSNIRSCQKLRKQFETLKLQMQGDTHGKQFNRENSAEPGKYAGIGQSLS